MKKILAAVISIAVIMQSAVAVYAGWELDFGQSSVLYSTDFSLEDTVEVDGIIQPSDWEITYINDAPSGNFYAEVSQNDNGKEFIAPYFELCDSNNSVSIEAKKYFEVPYGQTGILRTRFKYQISAGDFDARISIGAGDEKGFTLGSASINPSKAEKITVDGEEWEPFSAAGDTNYAYIRDILGKRASTNDESGSGLLNYPFAKTPKYDDLMWNSVELVINTSEQKMPVTLESGKSIMLGGGVYAVSMLRNGKVYMIKGYLPEGMTEFNNFSIKTPTWNSNSDKARMLRMDDLAIEFTPVVFEENIFENKITVKCGGETVSEPAQLGEIIEVENVFSNQSLSDKNAAVLAALYRNGYMINSASDVIENIPHYKTGEEPIYLTEKFSMTTPAEEIFGDMSLSVFTLEGFENIKSMCNAVNIPEKASLGVDFSGETVVPEIDTNTNTLTFYGITNPLSTVTYAVLKDGKELSQDMTEEDFLSSLYYFGETYANDNGEYSFSVKFAGIDAEYNLSINDASTIKSYPLTFANKIADRIMNDLNNIDEISVLKTKLDLFLEAIQYSNSAYNRNMEEIQSGDLFYNIFLDEITKNPVRTAQDVIKIANMSTLLFVLNNADTESEFVSIIRENSDIIDLTDMYAYELYSDEILTDADMKNYILADFAKNAYKNADILSGIEKFLNGYGDSTVLAVCRNTLGDAAGRKIIEMLNKRLGDTDKNFLKAYTDYSGMSQANQNKAAAAIMNRTYEDIDKVAESFAAAVKEASSDGNNNTSLPHTIGGGGGGGGSTSSKFTIPPVKTEEALIPPSYDIPKASEGVAFSDLSEAEWAEEYINKLSQREIVSGDEYGRFYPNNSILREEFVKMLIKTLGIETVYVGSNFDDVPYDSWFYEYISAAYAHGIVTGIDSTHFGTGQPVTREDMCTMLLRALKAYGVYMPEERGEAFSDDSDISSYAKDGVYALKEIKAVGGFPDGSFGPNRNASRAETAKILSLVIDYIEAEQTDTEDEGL